MSDDPAGDEEPTTTISKPDELLALHGVTAELFETLRSWFDVPPHVTLDLREVDSAVTELGDPMLIAAMAMRKLQALNLLATPGVMTTTDVVVTIVSDLDRALLQAPTMRLRLQAAETDWDEAFELLADESTDDVPAAPADARSADPEAERFQQLHGLLHEAVHAVLDASDGVIRYLV